MSTLRLRQRSPRVGLRRRWRAALAVRAESRTPDRPVARGADEPGPVHVPVLAEECLAAFAPLQDARGWIVDATLGAGGHSRLLLERYPNLRLLGTDQDPEILAIAQENLAPFAGRVQLECCRLSELARVIRKLRIGQPIGLLMDVGASSLQLDRPERGFSFLHDGPLDMRMDPERDRTAADIVNEWDESDLADLFFYEGGESRARRIAHEIVEARRRVSFQRTGALADLVARSVGWSGGRIHPATKVFQALRRAVNEEGEELRAGLATAEHWLADGGILSVIAFHSGEDGEVKRFLARELGQRLDAALAWEEERAPEGGEPRVVLAGPPNAGKSSLFNRLAAGEQRALVSDLAGTTRDSLTATWDLGALRARLFDLAGVDAHALGIDRTAQERAVAARASADLVLWVIDGSLAAAGSGADRGAEARTAAGEGVPLILVWNKLDLPGGRPVPAGWIGVSARTGEGLEELAADCLRALGSPGPSGSSGRELAARHRAALGAGCAELERAREGIAAGLPLDLVAEHLREATAALDGITGRTTAEDLLDRIFARFCLGK